MSADRTVFDDEFDDEFERAGLPVPPIPDDLRGGLQRLGTLHYSTLDTPRNAYALDSWVADWVDGDLADAGDFAHTQHTGHGVNSWAVHHYVSVGALGVFIQVPWGGASEPAANGDTEVSRVAIRFEFLDEILALVDCGRAGIEPGERICVVATDLGTERWARWSVGTPDWRRSYDALADVLEAIGSS